MRAATIAAMPNAHSHAFQRDLRGLGERNPDDFWSWRTQMMHLAQALDPESMQRVATQVYGEMLAAGYGAVGEFHYVHHGPDGTPYDEPNALALAVAQARARRRPARSSSSPPPTTAAGTRASTTPTSRASWRASTRCASGPTGATASRSPWPRTRCARCRPTGWRRSPATPSRPRPAAPRPRLRAAARGARLPRPARRQPDRAARAHRLPGPAHERRARDPRRRARHRAAGRLGDDRRHLPHDRGQPRRRPPAGAGLPRRRACGWPSARTRRCASTPSRRRASSRPAPAARARRAARCWPTTATCGPSWRATAWPASACEAGDTIDVDLDHPDLRGVGSDELALALATCASAGVVCRQASRVRAGGGSLS